MEGINLKPLIKIIVKCASWQVDKGSVIQFKPPNIGRHLKMLPRKHVCAHVGTNTQTQIQPDRKFS